MRAAPECRAAIEAFVAGRRFEIGNVIGAAAALVIATVAETTGRPLLVVAASADEARGLAADLPVFSSALVVRHFPSLEEIPGEGGETSFGARLAAVEALSDRRKGVVVVASVSALFDPVPSPDEISTATLALATGKDFDRDDLVLSLGRSGFERVSLVERAGQFAVRGAIVDVFEPTAANPLRIEFDGDFVESIRRFDRITQLSLGAEKSVRLSLVLGKGENAGRAGLDDAPPAAHLSDHMPKDMLVIVRDADDASAATARHLEQEELLRRPVERGVVDPYFAGPFLGVQRLPVPSDRGQNLDMGTIEARGADMASALATLEGLVEDAREVALCFAGDAERERFWEAVAENDRPEIARALKDGIIKDVDRPVSRGFRWRSAGRTVVNHRELFNIVLVRRSNAAKKRPATRAIDDFVDLKEGDIVVHVAHGIAKFVALERVEKSGEEQDFFVLEFRDAVRVYVPAAKADLVQKYIGAKGDEPQLSRLGGRHWSNKKAEVFRACTDLAVELLETQAIREREEGIAYPADSVSQHEFEAAFPYEETPDQLAAVEAIKADMESKRPMDRLVCGDVGYGKTEVAMRAVFKAAMAGKQAAVLVPTTVLAEQHQITFSERMRNFPVRVECLSRFKTAREQHEVLVALAEGKVDVVIGTHRLLGDDVVFKDLGLLVIDEEQRFGVAHKQRLRSLRRFVDVLTLSATPIPRTLHMSILGIRDISSLTQAPAARQPVETKIVPYEPGLVRAAVLHELERGGQCFFVHNRVKSIEKVRKELARIVPEARAVVAHGQMADGEIEAHMRSFVRQEADILVATTIIESGLDIPTANTIFIDRPEMYGLAELHQLRGRVGRYCDKAYAYLLLRPDSLPTSEAEKRLRAIEEFTELGSGFRIAMRDLEIRGAGNILGHEQHGHIAAVGYEMYCRLLDAAVKKLKRETVVLPDEVDINLNFEAALPKSYIPDLRAKLEMYRKLGRAATDQEFEAVSAEMRDRFGPPPAEAEAFVDVCRVRALLEKHRVRSIAVSPGSGILLRPAVLKTVLQRLEVARCAYRVIGGKDVLIVHPLPIDSAARVLGILRTALSLERARA